MTDPNREAIARRIRALTAKTVENGCTEAEALAAAEMLADLLAKYNMTLDEAELRASPFERHTSRHHDLVGERLWKIAAAVSHLTGARYWQSRAGVVPIEINFFGFAHEVDVARYLLKICSNAMTYEKQRRMSSLLRPEVNRRRAIPFLDGMADRLSERIRAMKPAAPTGCGLVVLHGALVDQAMKDKGFQTEDMRARRSRDFDPAYLHGREAGNRVPLNRGIGGRVAGELLR